MPNWCNNYMTISHPDPAKTEEALEAWNKGEFLEHFLPVPYELRADTLNVLDYDKCENKEHYNEVRQAIAALNKKYFGHESWYEWRLENWGTKWDIGYNSDHENEPHIYGNSFSVAFDSAWSPPTAAYEKLTEMGFHITAYYWESGMAFAGIWEDGADYFYNNITSAKIARRTLPRELDEQMGISESMEAWESEPA